LNDLCFNLAGGGWSNTIVTRKPHLRLLAALLVASGVGACSGAGGSGTGATTPSGEPSSGVTVTITPSGVVPKNLAVAPGSQVTFVNNDSRHHNMYSDPHPEHTDCPEFDSVGFLSPGQSRQTGNLNIVRTCGFHDHDDSENSKWRGNIVIQ
jgi:plastocyanin